MFSSAVLPSLALCCCCRSLSPSWRATSSRSLTTTRYRSRDCASAPTCSKAPWSIMRCVTWRVLGWLLTSNGCCYCRQRFVEQMLCGALSTITAHRSRSRTEFVAMHMVWCGVNTLCCAAMCRRGFLLLLLCVCVLLLLIPRRQLFERQTALFGEDSSECLFDSRKCQLHHFTNAILFSAECLYIGS